MKNTGYQVDKRIVDYIFLGSNSKIDNQIVMPNGDWHDYLPAPEYQRKGGMDTSNCVAFSALNAIEIYFTHLIRNKKISNVNYEWLVNHNYIINGKINFSDRFVGRNAGTKVGYGNTGTRVANAIIEGGLVPEDVWPFDEGMDAKEYYTKIPPNVSMLGIEFKDRFLTPFEVVLTKDISEALKYAPIQVFVNAWYNKNGIYYNPNNSINHAVVRVSEKGKQIFDHYDPFLKQLTPDYHYSPWGFKFHVTEIIAHMNVEEFLRDNDLLFVRNKKTGQFGRIMQEKLMVVETEDRGTLMLMDDAVRRNGRGLEQEEWDQLPIKKF